MLTLACRSGNLSVLEFVMQNGADLRLCDSYNRGPLHYCVGFGVAEEAIRLLLEKGADVDSPDCDQLRPVDVAAKLGLKEEILGILSPND